MFETTVVESRRKTRGVASMMLLPVSVVLHGVAIGATIFASIWTIDFPVNTPPVRASYQLVPPPPTPPPPPPPPAAPRPRPRLVEIPPAIQNMAPTVIPDSIPVLEEEPAEAYEYEEGVEGGVEGGMIGGVVGGVMGSLIDDAPPLPPDPSKGPLRVGGEVKAPMVIEAPPPQYPEKARNQRLNGAVVVECIIDKKGIVQNIKVISASDPMFEAAAVEAVSRWRFRPGTLWGEPVDTIFKLHVNFEMAKRGS